MKLLGTIVNVHKKQVVQKQILEKVITVKTFFVCYDKILNRAYGNFAYHVNVVTGTLGYKNISRFPIIQDFQKVPSTYYLAVCR